MRVLVSLIILLAVSLPLRAQEAPDFSNCAELNTDAVRLACYDEIARGNARSQGSEETENEDATIAPNSYSNWNVRTEVSRIDDSTKVFISTNALEMSSGRYGGQVRFVLLMACRENSTNIWIHFGGHFMSDHQHGRVTYRIDDRNAQTKAFRESNNHEALGLWSGNSAIPFIKSMFGAERLFVQATPYSESAVDGEFDISGLEEVVQPMREACNW